MQVTEQGESSGGALLQEELEQVKAEAAEQEKEFGELLACLGQESAKVAALQDLLLQRGFDPSGVLAQVRLPSVSCGSPPFAAFFLFSFMPLVIQIHDMLPSEAVQRLPEAGKCTDSPVLTKCTF